jgi:nucleotide-binding universal stress UspA family protein
MYKHLLVHLDAGRRAADRVELATKLAKRFGARLTGLFAQNDLFRPRRGVRGPSPARDFEAASTLFDERARLAGVEHEIWRVPDGEHDVSGIAARFCRYADLAILGQPDPDEPRAPQDLPSQVLLESGRPVLLVPAGGHFEDVGRRVVVGWAGSRYSARVLGDAIPLMRGAQEVHILDVRARGDGLEEAVGPAHEVRRHLAAHGIQAQAEATYVAARVLRASGMIALDLVLNRSAEVGADLVVIGARGRHEPSARIAHSAQRTLLESAAPLLISH